MTPLVTAGERVTTGDLVAESPVNQHWYRCVHAPLPGVIQSTETPTDNLASDAGVNGTARVLEIFAEAAVKSSPCCQHKDPDECTAEHIVEITRRAGLRGMGGGMFPTYMKLSPGRPIDCVIVNGCEGEPYLTCDHRVLVEHREEVECGMRLAMRAVGATDGVIATGDDDFLDGYELQLIHNVLGRHVPAGGRPSDVGVVVINVQTARSLHRAVCERRPLIDRVVTVDGEAVGRPGNYEVPLGTTVRHVLEACKVDWERTAAVIAGGPIMGTPAQGDTIVTSGIGGILALAEGEVSRPKDEPCIRCGRCQDVCPLGLPAGQLIQRPDELLLECIECGMCQFTCPSEQPIVQKIRRVKEWLRDGRRQGR